LLDQSLAYALYDFSFMLKQLSVRHNFIIIVICKCLVLLVQKRILRQDNMSVKTESM